MEDETLSELIRLLNAQDKARQNEYVMDVANDVPALCRHMQIRFDWPAENAANEILAMTLFGGIAVET